MNRKLIFNIVQNELTTTNNLIIQSNYAQYHVELVQLPVRVPVIQYKNYTEITLKNLG